MIKEIELFILSWLKSTGFYAPDNHFLADVILFVITLLAAYGLFYGGQWLATLIAKKILSKTGSLFNIELLRKKFFRRLAYLPALILVNIINGLLFTPYPMLHKWLSITISIAFMLAVIHIISAFLNAANNTYNATRYGGQNSMKSLIQAAHTILYCIAAIFIISLLLGLELKTLFTALGAASAVLMLVFKDSILGLVGGVQLSANRMVRPGDWIEMPSADADGTVLEISLITAKIRNWDNTIVTIPTYNLISQPVKNWRGMSEAGVRRIKRSIFIDMTSVLFCTDEMLERYRKIQFLDTYIEQKQAEIAAFNTAKHIDISTGINGRRQTNLGIFRAYLQRYLEQHPQLSRDFTLMARQLQPTNSGIPIEIYVFATTTEWVKYEAIQSDIFDHIIAAIPYFNLRIFQNPSWNDYQLMSSGIPVN
ncbi:MAG: mechanosensitive ion channel family protein [Prevotellaceae bacterium]|jgi:miniconductance mechanosensitive channel|nr:mechanosensitive ion channel family protein [Prevotellaceae bacterium]